MASSIKTTVSVDIDGRQAKEQLQELYQKAYSYKKNMKEALKTNDLDSYSKNKAELDRVNNSMKQLRKESYNASKVLDNLSGASMKELIAAEKKLQSLLDPKKIKRNSEAWNEVTKKIRKVTKEKKKLRNEMKGLGKQTFKFSQIFQGFITSIASYNLLDNLITSIRDSFRGAIHEFDKFEERFHNLSALTNLKGAALNSLIAKAKETSVSTIEGNIRVTQSADEIIDAYTKIGSQKSDLLKNADALHQVTKESIILSNAAKTELDPAASALTNSLNQFNASASSARRYINALAAGSQAGAADIPYLSQAIEKSGTSANMMKLEFEDLVALIETAAPKFSDASQAGNSLDKILMKMKSKNIGYVDGVFNINTALEELSSRFSEGEMASKIFGEEHAKMVQVLVDGREEFNQYRNTVTGTNTALEQAAINTDTRVAKRKQRLNSLKLIMLEFGEKFAPAVAGFTNVSIKLLSVFKILLPYLFKIGMVLGAYVIVSSRLIIIKQASLALDKSQILILYAKRAAIKANILLTRKATIAQKRKLVAIKASNKAMKSTPWGLIAAGAMLVGQYIYDLVQRLTTLQKIQKNLNDIESKYSRKLSYKNKILKTYMSQIKKTNAGSKERIRLVNQLDKNLPGLIDKQKMYGASIAELTDAENDYKLAIEKRIRTQIQEDKLKELIKQQVDQEEKLAKYQKRKELTQKRIDDATKSGIIRNQTYYNGLISNLEKSNDEIDKASKNLKKIKKLKKDIDLGSTKNKKKKNVIYQASFVKVRNDSTDDFEKEVYDDIIKEMDALDKSAKERSKYRNEVLKNSKSLIEQENINHTERLKKAGLFGKKREHMSKTDLEVLAALEKKHQEKLAKIDSEGNKYRNEILKSSNSLIEQENLDYKERLKKAGLFDKEKINMSKTDLLILAALEKKHQDKLDKIDSDKITKHLDKFRKANKIELDELKLKHAQELSQFKGSSKQKEALIKKQQKKERDLLKRHLAKTIGMLKNLLDSGHLDGLNLSDKILSPEEKEKLEDKIRSLKKQLADLGGNKIEIETSEAKGDILGYSADDWDSFNENLSSGKLGIEDMQKAAALLKNTFSAYDKLMSASENRQLKKYEKSNRRKKKILEKRLKSGQISEKQYNDGITALDNQYDAKKTEIEAKQAKRQKAAAIFDTVVNTAVGITAALKVTAPLGIALAAIVGAMGAAQTALIASQPLPGKEKGGYLRDDGKRFDADYSPEKRGFIDKPTVIVSEAGEEFVATAEAVRNPNLAPIFEMIDIAQKQGSVASLKIPSHMIKGVPGREQGGTITQDIIKETETSNSIQFSDSRIIDALMLVKSAIESKELTFPLFGHNSFDEMNQKINKFNKRTKR